MSAKDLSSSKWFTGPDFLWKTVIPRDTKKYEIRDSDVEVRLLTTDSQPFTAMEERFRRFSTKKVLVRGVACLLRWFARLQKRETLVLNSRRLADNVIVLHTQQEYLLNPAKSDDTALRQLDAHRDEKGF